MSFAALLWDLDGTLVDSEPVHGLAFAGAIAELGLTVAEDFFARTLGVNEARVHEMLVAETGTDLDLDAWRSLKWEHYQRHTDAITRRPGVADVALDWTAQSTPTGVVSNSTAEEVTIALSVTGLDQALTTTVSFADVTLGKPDPDGYLLAASHLGVAPAACLVIEDSPVGSAAGRAAGMTVIYHPQAPSDPAAAPGTHYLPPDGVLADLISLAMTTGRLP